MNRDTELNGAILRFICQCERDGDFKTLNNLGINKDTLDRLKTLTIQEILHIAQMQTSFIKHLFIDAQVLGNILTRARHESVSQQMIDSMIQFGAPLKLVSELTGISGSEFSARRQMLNVTYRGRSPIPDLKAEKAIYKAWATFEMRTELSGHEWIALAEMTDIPIRLIFKVIRGEEDVCHDKQF